MFKRLFDRADDFYHTSQIESFFSWVKLESETRRDSENVFINLPLQQELLETRTRKKVSLSDNSPTSFIISRQRGLGESLKILKKDSSENSWHKIFYAPEIEIWESKARHGETLPTRFGIGDGDRQSILSYSRKCMEEFFGGPPAAEPDLENKEEKVSLDVALWIDGRIRGSIIVENKPFLEAIKRASLGAIRDVRMKPVEAHELSKARIEICIFSSLVLPLRKADIKDGEKIDGRLAYFVKHANKKGWYLPAALNCVKFKDLEHLRKSLAEDKSGIAPGDAKDVTLEAFMVEGFMEAQHDKTLSLDGSVAFDDRNFIDEKNFQSEMRRTGDLAGEWLLSMQDEEGYMPLFADPLRSSFGKMDWGRLACSAYALASYGRVVTNEGFISGAKKTLLYLYRHVSEVSHLDINKKIIVYAYIALGSIELEDEVLTKDSISRFDALRSDKTFVQNGQHILHANIATLLVLRASSGDKNLFKESAEVAEKVFLDFEKDLEEKRNIQLTEYPELIYTFALLYKLTNKDEYKEKSEKIKKWLISQQFESGAFPQRVGSLFSYTRGTGKIFEGLSGDPADCEESLRRVFVWLSHMQYSESNDYFVEPAFRNRIRGGLRHDHANSEAWIDSAGHFLLGISRLIKP